MRTRGRRRTSRCSGSSPGARSSSSAPTARSRREATIKIWVDGERYVRTAEGNGPVQRARRRAALGDQRRSTRTSRDIELVNFKVRILDETHGHAARSRAC